MTTLEEYLATKFRDDRQEIEALSRALQQAANTFEVTFDGDHWPYKYLVETQKKDGKKSQGTWAMALCAVGKLLGKCKTSGRSDDIESKVLAKYWETALTALAANINPPAKTPPKTGGTVASQSPAVQGGPEFHSNTFGDNNAMTLSHVAELKSVLKKDSFKGAIATSLIKEVKRLSGLIEADQDASLLFPPPDMGEYRSCAFVSLRLLRAFHDLRIPDRPFIKLRGYFESGLHDQLSFSAIPDSRFDPAELLFCLEGLLLCAPEAVDGTSFQRILEVLAEKQNTSAHWRPNRPFMSSATGAIMLPLSIECANSLMRSVAIMDRDQPQGPFGARSLPLLHRFWNWLEARSVRFTVTGKQCIGWHSEHINDPNLVHIWDTSQVVEFMIAYRALLFKHIARTTLDLSGVKERRPKPLGKNLPPLQGSKKKYDWEDVKADREPLTGEAEHHQIYSRVAKYFIEPHLKNSSDPAFSMLLYGPPGTGKSTLAELMADTLKWPMLTVTVSDFLGSGGAMVEARAKAIFQMLEAQSNVIILFDEIDAFLLDRDSSFYREQETLFKFLTPGMLTKINDLRSAKRSIFIIATNYANRIDPAIKRIGRIDHKLLLLPPNLARREKMISKAWALGNDNRKNSGRTVLKKPSAKLIRDWAKASCYLGWNDIEGAVKAKVDNLRFDLEGRLKDAERSTGPRFYGRRLSGEGPFQDELLSEARWLYHFAKEAGIGEFETDFSEAVGDVETAAVQIEQLKASP